MPLSEIWLRMAAVKGVNGAQAREYLAKTAESAPLDPQALLNAVLTPRQHQRYRRCSPSELENARRWLAQPGHHLLAINDARYPRRLAVLDCPPSALFIAGDPACLETQQLAMVGSRQCSLYGKQWGDYFASQPARGCRPDYHQRSGARYRWRLSPRRAGRWGKDRGGVGL